MSFKPMMDALYHIGIDVERVEHELRKATTGNTQAVADLQAALTTISQALGEALDAYVRLPGKRQN
jgi:hypothetical protein